MIISLSPWQVAEEEGGHCADEHHREVALFALDGDALLPFLLQQATCRSTIMILGNNFFSTRPESG